jgi:hypothetical protein
MPLLSHITPARRATSQVEAASSRHRLVDDLSRRTPPCPADETAQHPHWGMRHLPCDEIITLWEKIESLEAWRTSIETEINLVERER